jgi:hypothetical protein
MTHRHDNDIKIEFAPDKLAKPRRKRRGRHGRSAELRDEDVPSDAAAAWRISTIFMVLILALMAWGFWA